MKIMLVNDDGCHARGIQTLCRALISAGHQATICAPDRERSAASHSATFNRPLTAVPFEENGVSGYAISGTPSDCAGLGLYLMDYQVDMVISGINHGPNMGGACVYSGTVGAAMEASMAGVPAMAVSILDYVKQENFEACAQVVVRMLDWIAARPLGRGEIYNLNVPDLPYNKIKGVRRANLSTDFLCRPEYEIQKSEEGARYKALFGKFMPNTDPECDSVLTAQGWATLTPLTWNMVPKTIIEAPEITL